MENEDHPPKVIPIDFGAQQSMATANTPLAQILQRICLVQAGLDALVSIHVSERFPQEGPARDAYIENLRSEIMKAAVHHLKHLEQLPAT